MEPHDIPDSLNTSFPRCWDEPQVGGPVVLEYWRYLDIALRRKEPTDGIHTDAWAL